MHILIVGAGLGGLSCAIGCRRHSKNSLSVTILERDAQLSEYGAGIQLPPNAARIMHNYGLLERLIRDGGAFDCEFIVQRKWDGEVLTRKPLRTEKWLGWNQYTIHRIDYQRILAEEAKAAGVEIRLGAKVVEVDCRAENPVVRLEGGEEVVGDVVIGADGTMPNHFGSLHELTTRRGMFSTVRTSVLQHSILPHETGDLAWRATIDKADILASGNAALIALTSEIQGHGWLGPDSHVAFYPLRGGSTWNLVLARPDDLPPDVTRQQGDLNDLRSFFSTWDPVLTAILSCVQSVQKWKLSHLAPLATWTRGAVALMGDACHPTLPYQAQGAAMAVEDGETIACLLSLLTSHASRKGLSGQGGYGVERVAVERVLKLYEALRKERTEVNVRGAELNRRMLHLPLGREQEERDRLMRGWDWEDLDARSEWPWFDPGYARELMGFDAEREARRAFASELGAEEVKVREGSALL